MKGVSVSSIPTDLQEYAEAILLPSWIIDTATTKIKYCNRRARALFTEVLANEPLKRYFDGEVSKAIISDLFSKGFYTTVLEFPVAGKSRKFQLTASHIKSAYALLTFLEISLKDGGVSKGRDYGYDDLFENATDLIQGTSLDGNIIYVNKAWVKRLGYSEQDSTRLNLSSLILPADRNLYIAHRKKILDGLTPGTIVLRLRSKNGDEIVVESNDHLKLVDGKPHSIRSIMRDITSTVSARSEVRKQAAKMQAMFNSGKLMFWTVNKNISLTSFNEQYANAIYKLYGKRPKINPDLDKPKLKFASNSYHQFWKKKYNSVFESGKGIVFQTKTRDLEGTLYFREIYLNPIFNDDNPNEVIEVAGMGIDITDKKLAQKQLQEEATKTQTIFNAVNHMVWSLDKDWNFTSLNDVFRKNSIQNFNRQPKLGENFLDYVKDCSPETLPQWETVKKELRTKTFYQFEIAITNLHGTREIEDVTVSPIFDDENELKEIACISQNITYRKAAERKLKEQAAKISSIFNSSAMIIWSVDERMHLVSFNEKFAREFFRWFGKEVSIGTDMLAVLEGHVKREAFENYRKIVKRVFQGNPEQFEGVVYTTSGKKIWLESFYRPMYSGNKKVSEMSCMAHDITDKKTIEYQMRESIREKEILLQEVHHRVKNNLQVISSILNLQSSYVKDDKSLSILRESQNRIKSMSFIHESLYQTRDFSKIEFTGYIQSLVTNLIHTYHIRSSEIELKTDFEKNFLELDQAIPCGLIVNELISNSLQYAFKGRNKGEIFVGFKEDNGKFTLRLADNGVGLPENVDFKNTETLGLQLVNTLADQLDACISVDNESGTDYLITFDKQ